MLNINEDVYTSTIITSLNRIFKRIHIDGQLNIEEIYLLNTVHNLLNTMCLNLTNEQRKNLMSFYNRIAFKSDYICTGIMLKAFEQPMKSKFEQAFVDPNTIITNRDVNYWKSALITTPEIIISDVNAEFLKNQLSITRTEFSEGYSFVLPNIGRLCFFINLLDHTNLAIFDELGNNVTNLFTIEKIESLNGVIIISDLVYNELPLFLKLLING